MESELTVCELDTLCAKLFKLREEKEVIEGVLESKQREIGDIERTIEHFLEVHGKEKYHVQGFGTVSVQNNFSFKTPKTPEAKALFFDYLKKCGVYDEFVTVNSQTLNAFCKAELAVAEDPTSFSIPGIEMPTTYKKIKITKDRK